VAGVGRWGGLLTLSFPGHLLDKVPAMQRSAITQVRWVSKSRVIWLTLEEMHKTRRACAPTHDY
jgi:hypothetical protein